MRKKGKICAFKPSIFQYFEVKKDHFVNIELSVILSVKSDRLLANPFPLPTMPLATGTHSVLKWLATKLLFTSTGFL